jgi:predicted porin
MMATGHTALAQMTTQTTLLPDARSLPVAPTPGQVIVRLGGHINFYAMALSDSGNSSPGYKQAGYSFLDYVHLNPSVDGMAANGLKYGAFVDIWQEKPVAPGGGSGGGISPVDRTAGSLYVRREWIYMGTDKLGTIRLGTGDSVGGLYQTGTFENFDDGGWNGDVPSMFSSNTTPTWPFDLVGNLYTPTKLTYLSPQFSGVEFGATYEPNTGNVTTFDGVCPTAGTGCDRLSSSANTADLARRRNMLNIEARYRAVFGPVGIATEVGWFGSGHVNYDGTLPPTTVTHYDGFNQGVFGFTATYAGLTVGGHLMAGRFNGQWGLDPKGAPDSIAYLMGASYTVGPLIVGASFFQYDSAGNAYQGLGPHVGTLRERGVAAGGTYSLTPGVSLILSYLYGDRKERGYDLLDATPGSNHNNVRAQGISIGTQLRW